MSARALLQAPARRAASRLALAGAILASLTLAALLAMALAGAFVGCTEEVSKMTEAHPPKSRDAVREILARHRDTLIRRHDAVGVGIGKKELHDEGYVIVVYLAAPRRATAEDAHVDGVPVVFRVTGRIHPLPRGETPDE